MSSARHPETRFGSPKGNSDGILCYDIIINLNDIKPYW